MIRLYQQIHVASVVSLLCLHLIPLSISLLVYTIGGVKKTVSGVHLCARVFVCTIIDIFFSLFYPAHSLNSGRLLDAWDCLVMPHPCAFLISRLPPSIMS